MGDTLIITFDHKDGDVAALFVSRKIFDAMYETKLEVIKEFTGDDAVSLYNLLTKKEVKKCL